MTDKSKHYNRLINESSPYLRQHAQNPVDWYPWGQEAFKKAKEENKLIFLSIGYYSCHWCHVMEEESFEDLEVAKLLNENYIAIKVDREERKDIDAIYMKACQAMTGAGGWPLNLWLTPDKLPIYAGTYFPKNSYMNRIGLMESLTYFAKTFIESPKVVFNKSYEIITSLKRAENHKDVELDPDIVDLSVAGLKDSFNQVYGGFSEAPKFPIVSQLLFLLDTQDSDNQDMVVYTLEQMIKGGIYDHVGSGFSRYSVDNKWLIPHFEKMLYDNGQLLDVLARAYEISKNKVFKQVMIDTVDFLERELFHDRGGFYSAIDADSEGVEGKYYRFTLAEIQKLLGHDSQRFIDLYHVTLKGNFEGYNVLNLINQPIELYLDKDLLASRKKLFTYRLKRVYPNVDDKIQGMSNGYAISGLAAMYKATGYDKALKMAIKTVDYIKAYMIDEEGRLLSVVRNNQGATPGTIDDYASVISGCLALYDVSLDTAYLDLGHQLNDKAFQLFWDQEHGGYFVGRTGDMDLIFNPKEIYDGAHPSGNSLMAMNLLKFFLLEGEVKYKRLLDEMIHGFSHKLNQYKHYSAAFIRLIHHYEKGTKELKLCIPNESLYEKALAYMNEESDNYFVRQILVDKSQCLDGKATLYRCQKGSCSIPQVVEL